MAEGTETAPEQQPEGGNSGFTPPASQEEFDRIIGGRVERERSKFGDYDDLKAKAAKLDDIEAANKSEQQKLEERLSVAELSASEARTEALRFRVATKFGVSDEDAELFLTGSDEATLTKQAQRLSERADQQKKSGLHVSREGVTTPSPKADPMREYTRSMFAKSE